ncbi:MAG: hypothetical protein JOY71_14105 [Acetobacteraceae bacterium]|nr:hypothetical protein [Acetobacteraceae bacterium]
MAIEQLNHDVLIQPGADARILSAFADFLNDGRKLLRQAVTARLALPVIEMTASYRANRLSGDWCADLFSWTTAGEIAAASHD